MGGGDTTGEVIILGAGFSKAISSSMPLTDELGTVALESAGLGDDARVPSAFEGGYFESWLSRLAEDQPDLSAAENLENRGLFIRVAGAIHEVLQSRQLGVLAGAVPAWLTHLVGLMHDERSTVVTFNYDCLIEHAVAAVNLGKWPLSNSHRVLPRNVLAVQPPPPPSPGGGFPGYEVSTLGLLKLHGSLNWYWNPGDTTGATIARWDLAGSWGSPEVDDGVRRRRLLPGREPFIVPPSATKTTYYGNPFTQEMWQTARRGLLAASRVTMVGYSMPATDLVMSGMLGESIGARSNVEVEVVNLDPEPVVQRLTDVGVQGDRIDSRHRGPDAVEGWVDGWRTRAAKRLVEQLRIDTSDCEDVVDLPIAVATTRANELAVVVGIQPASNGALTLMTEDPAKAEVALGRRGSSPPPAGVAELSASLADRHTLQAQLPSGECFDLTTMGTVRSDIGHRPEWQLLAPPGFNFEANAAQ